MTERGTMETAFRPVAVLMSGRVLALVGTMCIPVVLARLFDRAEFGTYKQLFLIYATMYPLAISMAESLFYFLPLARDQGGRYAANAVLVLLTAGLGGLALLTLLDQDIARWLGNPALSPYLSMLGIYLTLTLGAAVLEIVLVSRHRYGWAALSYGLSDVLRAACLIVPAFWFHRLDWLLTGAVVFAGVRFCVMAYYLRREFAGEIGIHLGLLRTQLAYTLPFQASAVLGIMHLSAHQYAVSARVDAATFAIYAVGCLQLPAVDLVAGPAANVMMVQMGERRRDRRSDGVLTIWSETTRRLALVLFPLVGCVLVSARELILLLYTKNYEASVPIFMLWSLMMLFAVLQTDAVLRVYAETRYLLLLHVTALLAVVTSVGWFLSTFQLPGAVLATLLAAGLVKGLGLVRVKRLLGARMRQLLPWRSLASIGAAAGTAGLAALAVNTRLDIAGPSLLLVTAFVYGGVYLAMLLGMDTLTEAEKLTLVGWLPRRVARLPS
jgi:O-antigen/teichoic acid export membrane protein